MLSPISSDSAVRVRSGSLRSPRCKEDGEAHDDSAADEDQVQSTLEGCFHVGEQCLEQRGAARHAGERRFKLWPHLRQKVDLKYGSAAVGDVGRQRLREGRVVARQHDRAKGRDPNGTANRSKKIVDEVAAPICRRGATFCTASV